MSTILEIQDIRNTPMMTLQISDQLTLLYGPNGVGKSNISEILRILTTNEKPKPEYARTLVSYGKAMGMAKISKDGSEKTWTIPENSFTLSGLDNFKSSPGAVDLQSFLDMKSLEDRFEALSTILNTEITFEDFVKEMADTAMTEDGLKSTWETHILNATSKKPDFKNAHTNFENQRRDQKADWRKITGKSAYPDKNAVNWQPEGYERDLMEANEESLRTQLSTFESARDAALQDEAVSIHVRDALEAEAAAIPELKKKLSESKARKDELYKKIADMRDELNYTGSEFKCECGKHYLIREGGAHAFNPDDGISQYTAEELNAKISEASGELLNLSEYVTRTEKSIEETEKKIKELPEKKDTSAVEKARGAAEKAKIRLKAFIAFRESQRLAKEVEKSSKLVAVTAPDGLPGKKLAAAIVELNKVLAELSEAAGWETVKIANNTGVTLGGENYLAVSGGRKFRVRATIQFAFALADNSEIVIIDPTDTLDRKGKDGILNLIDHTGIPAFITVKADDKKDCMTPEDGDCIYWLEDGTATSMAPVPL